MDRNWARGAAIASVLAASVAACGSAATASPTSAVAAQPSPTVATPSIEATAISLVSANPISEGCGSPAMEAVIADMGNSGPINLTKEKFAEIWNGWWPKEADKLNRIPAWGPLGEMAGFQGYGEFLPVSGQEDMFLVLQAPSGEIQSIALSVDLAATVTNPIGPSPLSSGLFMTVFARIMDANGEGDLNRLGFFAPLSSYDQLAGVNACLTFGKGLYMRLVEVPSSGGRGPYIYLYIRSANPTDTTSTPTGHPSSSSSPSALRTVTGSFSIVDIGGTRGRIKATGTTCQGQGQFADIGAETPVVLRDENGKMLASTTLGPGTGDPTNNCTFSFRLTDVPVTPTSYSLQIGQAPPVTITRAALEADAWHFEIANAN
jgi:hypothetical protein